MKIGELAKQAGTSTETIRYYEQVGLLQKAVRSESNYRVYALAHLERMIFIRHCRTLDMTLDEIRILLHFKSSPDENCCGVNRLLDEHISHVAQRIAELQELEQQLRDLRQLCPDDREAEHCGILMGLSQASAGEPAMISHVAGVHLASPSKSQ